MAISLGQILERSDGHSLATGGTARSKPAAEETAGSGLNRDQFVCLSVSAQGSWRREDLKTSYWVALSVYEGIDSACVSVQGVCTSHWRGAVAPGARVSRCQHLGGPRTLGQLLEGCVACIYVYNSH